MSRSDRILTAAGGAALILAVAAGWILASPSLDGETPAPGDEAFALLGESAAASPAAASSPSAVPSTIVVDVEGAVAEPGIRELPAGSRVADAIAAAGGYGPDADLDAAAAAINLAERLLDGAQIVVPRVGAAGVGSGTDSGTGGGPGGPAPGDPGGPVNLNTASAEELEALPGIGPVTVDRIIEARRQQPFTSLDDAVQRGVLNRGQLEDLEGVATAG